MRILLVDNYDSYTFNVAHLLARVAGVAPNVVRNDAWDLDAVRRFDPHVVVISPGPGRPGPGEITTTAGSNLRTSSRSQASLRTTMGATPATLAIRWATLKV